jgi:hypothetical protein
MQRVLMLSVSAAAMAAWAASAVADSPQLKGVYGFTGNDNCIATPNGFISSDLTAIPPAHIEPGAVGGTLTFNGDGTGTATGSTTGIHFGPTLSWADAATFSFSFTYTVNGDGTFTGIASTPLTGTGTAGPTTGQPYSITNVPSFEGQISQSASTLTVATLTPTVETVTVSGIFVHQSICHSSRVLIKLPSGQ